MDWRDKTWVGIVAGLIALIGLVATVLPLLLRRAEEQRALKQSIQWMKQERQELPLGEEGWSRGVR